MSAKNPNLSWKEDLKKAQEKRVAMRAAGIAPPPRKNVVEQAKAKPTLTKCLRAYFFQHHGVIENSRCEGVELLREDAERDYRAARERSLKPGIGLRAVIDEICWCCEAGDIDPGAGERIRDCKAPHCALHPVRMKVAIRWRPETLEQP